MPPTTRSSKPNSVSLTTNSSKRSSKDTPKAGRADDSGNTFILPSITPPVPVTLPAELSQEQLLEFPAFQTWLSSLQKSLDLQSKRSHPLHDAPYKLRAIEIQSCDFFSSKRLGFLKFRAEVSNDNGEHLPASVFMRGGSVAMLVVLTPTDSAQPRHSPPRSRLGRAKSNPPKTGPEEYAILVVQPRIPAGSLSFTELPAGMIDDSGTFSGVAAREIREETGLTISDSELIDMTALALQSRTSEQSADESHLQTALYPSPGGSDEFIPIFLARRTMAREDIEGLRGRLTGLRDQGEKITLKICRLDEVWKVAGRDAKSLAAIALYEGLKREGRV